MKRFQLFTAGLALTVMSAAALAQDDPKALFHARYGELRAAMDAKDAAAIGKVVTPDYAMTDIRGDVHDAAGLSSLADRLGGTDRKSSSEVLTATITGASAAVENKVDSTMTRTGQDGQPHQMELIVISSDSWVLIDGAWRLKSSVQKDLTVKRDGDEMFHQAN